MSDNTGVDPQNVPAPENNTNTGFRVEQSGTGHTMQVDPATSEDTTTTSTTPDLSDLKSRLDEMESKLKATHAENADKRFKLKTQREQFEAISAEYEDLKEQHGSKLKEIESLTNEINEYRAVKEAQRTALLDSMKDEHKTMFADLPLDKLEAIHKELYSSPSSTPTPSVGSKKPLNTSEIVSEDPSLFGFNRIRKALGQ